VNIVSVMPGLVPGMTVIETSQKVAL
jgi:hypothetical protein